MGGEVPPLEKSQAQNSEMSGVGFSYQQFVDQQHRANTRTYFKNFQPMESQKNHTDCENQSRKDITAKIVDSTINLSEIGPISARVACHW